MIDPDSRAATRLRDERVIWLTTVRKNGQPQTSPVWFLWDGATFLIYSKPDVGKLANITANPRVSLNLDGNGQGGDIVVLEGTAALAPDAPPAHEHPAYVAAYAPLIKRNGWTPESFASDYSVALRITPTRVRAW